ncbi:glutamyl-tRNA synthetase [Dysgonomonas sp. PFB1-18]|uniref:glutamate--tRNA ligase n=1 Tax=unclassified Dysgonomonas TaxID=2630389 RepID=UPI0024743CEA|nr:MULTISPECIES: glutamate--tRNA ligase [unclassified Dysgonomonas]MDH6310375.1 glutamyl-tRNA synthetase [Dysgonomonas sp. PF1-14]MDH6340295.1 glutamyl-tRNA synthetase [Dysgonomonas sp. PF1-16]MDH6381925.1 glutamyl-tRNA synthetase [Dysgonomonas sp. PFB1-18]MDH6399266.1 glutamyl-tRNA synthetase [Dysgonomonas sp. PF1-23]
MSRKVRVRFAPSPTGPLHIGGVRTALYNYLFARKHKGDFILRIEDTDSQRFVPGAEEYIIEALTWLGLQFDEGTHVGGSYGPYRQSDRKEIYKKYVDQLLDAGKAYIAFDTPQELEAKRAAVSNFQYDASTRDSMRNSLTLSSEEVTSLIDAGQQYVVRFKIDADKEVIVNDIIRGEVKYNSSVLDDKVLYKSVDSLPTYHLANIVDDHLMEITHVIRGEEWLPSAPLHVLLYRAFGWEDTMPQFAHLPLLLKPEGNGKLSKRDGDRLGFPVFPLEWKDPITGDISSGYRESGYLPEAVINFLALLGWNPGNDQEIMSMDELIELFSLEKCSKSGAKFDYEKGKWFNHQYIQLRPNAEIANIFYPILEEKGVDMPLSYVETVVGLVKERVSFVKELWDQSSFFFIAPVSYDEKVVKKRWKEESPAQIAELIDVIKGIGDFSSHNQEEVVKGWIENKGYHLGNIMNAFRLAIVGESKGPHMFDITAAIGKDETIARLERAIKEIKL